MMVLPDQPYDVIRQESPALCSEWFPFTIGSEQQPLKRKLYWAFLNNNLTFSADAASWMLNIVVANDTLSFDAPKEWVFCLRDATSQSILKTVAGVSQIQMMTIPLDIMRLFPPETPSRATGPLKVELELQGVQELRFLEQGVLKLAGEFPLVPNNFDDIRSLMRLYERIDKVRKKVEVSRT